VNGTPLAVFLFVELPLLVVWLYVLQDISRARLPVGRKVAWAIACTLVWPVQFLYLLAGPQRGRVAWADRRGRHARLVRTVMDLEAGRIDRETFNSSLTELASHPTGRRHPDRPSDAHA
jgi:hypothetical protein